MLHPWDTIPHILTFEGHDETDSPVVNDKNDSDDEDESGDESQSEERKGSPVIDDSEDAQRNKYRRERKHSSSRLDRLR